MFVSSLGRVCVVLVSAVLLLAVCVGVGVSVGLSAAVSVSVWVLVLASIYVSVSVSVSVLDCQCRRQFLCLCRFICRCRCHCRYRCRIVSVGVSFCVCVALFISVAVSVGTGVGRSIVPMTQSWRRHRPGVPAIDQVSLSPPSPPLLVGGRHRSSMMDSLLRCGCSHGTLRATGYCRSSLPHSPSVLYSWPLTEHPLSALTALRTAGH